MSGGVRRPNNRRVGGKPGVNLEKRVGGVSSEPVGRVNLADLVCAHCRRAVKADYHCGACRQLVCHGCARVPHESGKCVAQDLQARLRVLADETERVWTAATEAPWQSGRGVFWIHARNSRDAIVSALREAADALMAMGDTVRSTKAWIARAEQAEREFDLQAAGAAALREKLREVHGLLIDRHLETHFEVVELEESLSTDAGAAFFARLQAAETRVAELEATLNAMPVGYLSRRIATLEAALCELVALAQGVLKEADMRNETKSVE